MRLTMKLHRARSMKRRGSRLVNCESERRIGKGLVGEATDLRLLGCASIRKVGGRDWHSPN